MLRLRWTCLVVLVLPMVCGCSYMHDATLVASNRTSAEVAWLRSGSKSLSGLPYSLRRHFGFGFVQGYSDVANGASGKIPIFPPQCYWAPSYRTVSGREKVTAWFRGYEAGASAAFSDGMAGSSKLPTSRGPAPSAPSVQHPTSETPAPPHSIPIHPSEELPPSTRRPVPLEKPVPVEESLPLEQPLPLEVPLLLEEQSPRKKQMSHKEQPPLEGPAPLKKPALLEELPLKQLGTPLLSDPQSMLWTRPRREPSVLVADARQVDQYFAAFMPGPLGTLRGVPNEVHQCVLSDGIRPLPPVGPNGGTSTNDSQAVLVEHREPVESKSKQAAFPWLIPIPAFLPDEP